MCSKQQDFVYYGTLNVVKPKSINPSEKTGQAELINRKIGQDVNFHQI